MIKTTSLTFGAETLPSFPILRTKDCGMRRDDVAEFSTGSSAVTPVLWNSGDAKKPLKGVEERFRIPE